MLARLLQVDAIAWAVQHDLALLAATLRADASMHRRAEALLFSSFADGAGQEISLRLIMACEKSCRSSALGRQAMGFGVDSDRGSTCYKMKTRTQTAYALLFRYYVTQKPRRHLKLCT